MFQLWQDKTAGTRYNLVGFQTSLRWAEQKRVISMIPGLENAESVQMWAMYRRTFINSLELRPPTIQCHARENLFFAGQMIGAEGYAGNVAAGLLAGV